MIAPVSEGISLFAGRRYLTGQSEPGWINNQREGGMIESSHQSASTHKGTLVGKTIRVRAGARRHFTSVYGQRGFAVNDAFVVTADDEYITKDGAETRIITFEDDEGRVATAVASGFVVIDAGGTQV